ncbi:hypothetical protein [Swingsia samuiensis]|nr:hypothetical protein [Swingsia samuiensis]
MSSMINNSVSEAAEPGSIPVPASITSLTGCWHGEGEVMGKPVTITIVAKSIVQNAMFSIDVDSVAKEDPSDRYSAHLIFGGDKPLSEKSDKPIIGFWSDSFGGSFSSLGKGISNFNGFEITYGSFINKWKKSGEKLNWNITSKDKKGKLYSFASYSLTKTICSSN